MKNLSKFLCVLIVLLSIVTSCEKNSEEPISEELVIPHSLIVGGFFQKATLWVDGERTDFLDQFVSGRSIAYDIQVVDKDVYILLRDSELELYKIIKNDDIVFEISEDAGTINQFYILNDNIYACGSSRNDGVINATLWVNGEKQILDESRSFSRKIWVNGNDIYVAGSINENISSNAVYWKNGERVVLNQTNDRTRANDIVALDGKTYSIGYGFNDQSRFSFYWEDGVESDLYESLNFSDLNNMVINDNSIHILGKDHVEDQIKVFNKNSFTIISGDDTDCEPLGIKSFNNEIYVFGEIYDYEQESDVIKIWKGDELFLSFTFEEGEFSEFDLIAGDVSKFK